MPGAIVLTGFSSDDPVPGAYLEINFAQGEAAGSGSPIEVLLMGNKLPGGAATVDTVVYGPDTPAPLQTETDAIALFGAGSELHRMFRAFTKVNQSTTLRALAVTEAAGAKATGTVTVTGAATGNGSARVWVHDEFVDVPVTTGDSVTAIASAIAAAVNQKTHWGITASSALGVVTLTAKQNGTRGNLIRYVAVITPGITTAVSPGTDTAFTGGATDDSNATALGTINPKRYYYIVPAAVDATQLGALSSQVGTQAAPITGIRQRVVAGSVDTLANAQSLATTLNNARAEIAWSEKSPWTPSEIAANHAAIVTLFETKPNPRTNFAGFGQDAVTSPFWRVPAARLATAHPSRTSIKSALNNGLSPIAVQANGATYLVNRITTRSLQGAQNDYRIRSAHKVTICDFFGDDLLAKTVLQFSGKRIAGDPVQGQRPPGGEVVTPTIYKGAVFRLIDDYDANDLLQNVAEIKARTVVQRETVPTTRMSARIPLQPIDNAEQFAIALDQVA